MLLGLDEPLGNAAADEAHRHDFFEFAVGRCCAWCGFLLDAGGWGLGAGGWGLFAGWGFSILLFFLLFFDVAQNVFAADPRAFGGDIGRRESVLAKARRRGRGDGNLRVGFAIFLRNFTIRLWRGGLFLIRYRLLRFLRGCFPGCRSYLQNDLFVGFFVAGASDSRFSRGALPSFSR